MQSKVLLVRHGAGRGRFENYANAWIKAIAGRPGLAGRVLVHETGPGSEPSLDGISAVFFLMADPLKERYPDCYAQAARIADRAVAHGIRVVNPPDALSNTIKTVQARLWSAQRIPCAGCEPYTDRAAFEQAVARVAFPAIIRPDQLHAQQYTFLCHTREEALAISPDQLRFPGLVLEFVDSREGYARTAADSVWSRYYHRKRAYVFGDRVLAQAIYFSEGPIVAAETATFTRYAGASAWQAVLLPFRRWDRETIRADVAFATGEADDPDLLRRSVHTLGLGFAAVDYARLADGRLVLWEANPHPSMPVWHTQALSVPRGLRRRWNRLHRAALDFIADLL